MTNIKSMYDKKLDITPSPDFPGWVRIKCEDGSALHAAGHHESRLYTTADLAAALGLPTREELDRNLEMTQRERDTLRAELDEAEATIARVKAAIEQSSTVDCAEIWIALDPRPAFVLPTEVPATIEAKRIHFGWTSRLALWTDGTERFWRAEYDGQDYTEAGVMDGMFTGHRLVGAES